jgi:hypothetical protein
MFSHLILVQPAGPKTSPAGRRLTQLGGRPDNRRRRKHAVASRANIFVAGGTSTGTYPTWPFNKAHLCDDDIRCIGEAD